MGRQGGFVQPQRTVPARTVPTNFGRQGGARPTQPVQPALGGQDENGRVFVWPTGSARSDYNAAARIFGENVVLFPGSLRVESAILATTNNIVFRLEENQGGANINETRLAINDAFIARYMSIQIGRRLTANTLASEILHTFPNTFVFTAANEAVSLPAFYNGKVSIQVNDIVYAQNVDMLSFMRADNAQQGTAVSSVALTGIQAFSSTERDRAFLPLTPQIVFNGPSRNVITIQLPDSVNLAAAAGSENRAVLMFRGLWAQNAGRQRNR